MARKGTFLWKKSTFYKKGHQIFHPSYSIPFLNVLHQNKALYNFHKRGQHSIVKYNIECNIGLEYTLLVASNAHISKTLSHPLWKNVNDWKSYVPTVPRIMFFKVLKYFSNGKIRFFLVAFQIFFLFFRNLDPHNSRLFSPEKCWICKWP